MNFFMNYENFYAAFSINAECGSVNELFFLYINVNLYKLKCKNI